VPDISDLLTTGAGEPLGPLDLDRVERRASERARNRRIAQAVSGSAVAVVGLVAAVGLTGLGDRDHAPPYASLSAPDDVVPIDPSVDRRLQPVPAKSKALLPDGNSFVLIKEVRPDRRLVVDKVDRALTVAKQAKCSQVGTGTYSPTEVFSFCWQNANSLLRTPAVSDQVEEVPIGHGQVVGWSGLAAFVAGATEEARTTVWAVDVRDGVITSIALANLY
jgi:hypothetical protein